MADVRELGLWNERVQRFKEFARLVDAEFNFKILENGKECVELRQYYRPRKEDTHDINNDRTTISS